MINNLAAIKKYLTRYQRYLIFSLCLIIFLLMYLYRYKIIALTLGEYKQVFPMSALSTGYLNVGVNTFEDSIYSISCNFSSLTQQKFIKWNGDTLSNQSISCGLKLIFNLDKELYGYDSSVIIIRLDSSNTRKLPVTRIFPLKVGTTKIFFNLDRQKDTIKVKIINKGNNNLVVEEIYRKNA